jgi:hypothetical protein
MATAGEGSCCFLLADERERVSPLVHREGDEERAGSEDLKTERRECRLVIY